MNSTRQHIHTFLAAAIISLSSALPIIASERPPNNVLIFADNLGYGDLGCYGALSTKQ